MLYICQRREFGQAVRTLRYSSLLYSHKELTGSPEIHWKYQSSSQVTHTTSHQLLFAHYLAMGRVGEGLSSYYKAKIEELEIQARDKQHNLRRLEAQRNELNTKGESTLVCLDI